MSENTLHLPGASPRESVASTLLFVAPDAIVLDDPTNSTGQWVNVMHWPDLGLVIPWPKGMTAKQAVEEWKQNRGL